MFFGAPQSLIYNNLDFFYFAGSCVDQISYLFKTKFTLDSIATGARTHGVRPTLLTPPVGRNPSKLIAM